MLVAPKFAKKHDFNVKSTFQIIGGSLDKAKIALIDPTENTEDLDFTVDYKNIFGTRINILDSLSKIFLSFEKAKVGNHGKRLTMLCVGPSGCGKSTFCTNYVNIFRRQHKDYEKYPIYYLTPLTDDNRLSKVKGCHVVDLNDEEMIEYYLVNEETKLTTKKDFFGKCNLNNALVVADDIDKLKPGILSLVEDLLSHIMLFGRHSNTNLIWSRHVLTGRNKLIQESISEIQYIALFRDSSFKKLNYFTKNYLDYDDNLVSWVRKESGSRYTLISNKVPQFVLNEDQLIVLK